jgi:hypothetical protein
MGYKDPETGLHVCGFNGCEEAYKTAALLKSHQERVGGRAKQDHADLLFVYLPHYLVFKTDIVISVNVPCVEMFHPM